VATKEWILLIPRTHQAHDSIAPANGASMMGLVWVADQIERDQWTELGMSDHLAYLGIPS
jgi:ATP adenylyltransferase